MEKLAPDQPAVATNSARQKMFHFKRSRRLLSASDYKNVFDKSHFRVSHKNALMLAHLNQTENSSRLGLVFGKKNVALSVDRNRLKRISREQFRLNSEGLAGLDIVILARAGLARLDNVSYKKLVLDLMENIKQQFGRKIKS